MMKIASWGTQMTTSETKVEEVKKVDETKDVEEKEVVNIKIEPTQMEVQATEQGWVPKELWVGQGNDPDDWRTAKEFVERGELYKSLHNTKRDLKQTQVTLTALQKHHQFVFEKAHKQAVEELKREKRAAIRAEDFEKVEAVEDEIEKVQEQHVQEREALVKEQQVVQTNPHPEFQAWVGRNLWYTRDEELREFADAVGVVYMNKNPTAAPQDILRQVESETKKHYAAKFGNVKKSAPNAVVSVNRTGNPGRKTEPDFELTETEQDIMKELVSQGVLTKEKYIEDLKKAYKKG